MNEHRERLLSDLLLRSRFHASKGPYREAIQDLCEVLSIELTDERKAELQGMHEDALSALRERIKREKRWA